MAGFHRLFIANRGEVAVRIARTCDELGITPVFGVSAADRDAPWTENREQIVLGPARSTQSYLAMARVVQAARQTGCTALHPGWGFLAENPVFAALCEQHGVTFIGPPPHVMHLMGKKTPAKKAMGAAGLTLIPGSGFMPGSRLGDGILADLEQARVVAEQVGYPVLLKAESGGGGKGMRIARGPDEIEQAWSQASAEALAAFADGRLYLEKLVIGGRHIEIQVMADRYGNVVHLGERDCTVQRNHQKLIEESPAPTLDPEERARTLAAAVAATARIGYVGAGTIEFLLDQSEVPKGGPAVLRFMEMNTRLQVEHCVSEMRSGVDLVREQILVAAGHPLSIKQSDITLKGHAIECRINAEDPSQDFRPSPGLITQWVAPEAADGRVRVDTHVRTGYEVPPYYDSLICKVITWGETRDAAADEMIRALSQLRCEGVATTIPMHLEILASPAFRANDYDTRAIPGFTTTSSTEP